MRKTGRRRDPQADAHVLAIDVADEAGEAIVERTRCSDLAACVSGETIVVDGGFGIWNGT